MHREPQAAIRLAVVDSDSGFLQVLTKRLETAGWQYIERIEVKSLEQHDKDLASPAGVKLREELYGRFLDRSKNVYFASDTIE